MILIECQQGTPQWFEARAGVITASEFEVAISKLTRTSGGKKAGDPTDASDRYACDKAIERVSGKPYGIPPKAAILARGHDLEPKARMGYEAKTEMLATESGIVLTDDRKFGYSTDGFVGEDGLIEIKCPIDGFKIATMWRTGDVSEYMHQMQGGMWITGRKWCDFIMYVPDLAPVGKDLYVKRIERDDNFIDAMVEELLAFDRRVDSYRALFSMKEAA